jgi:hypothetical protein
MDDVEWLNKHGVEETYIFIADSSLRDKAAYPTPSEYEIVFNSQFRNVVKFEILEVNIPRTDYIVDETENTFVYAVNQPKSISTWKTDIQGNIRTMTITPGDYNLPQLIDIMNSSFQATSNAYGDTVTLRAVPTTNPSEISNKIRIEGSGPFTILGDDSTLKGTIGFGDPVSTSDTGFYSTVPGYNINFPNGASNVFLSNQGVIGNGETVSVFVGPIPSGDNTSYEGIYTGRSVRQYFNAATTGVPSSVSAYMYDVSAAPAGGFVADIAIKRATDNSTIATGNIISINDDLTPSVSGPLTVSNNFVQGTQYYVEFTPSSAGTSASNCTSLWYTFPNLPPVPGAFMAINGNTAIHPGEYFCTDVVAGAYGSEIISPGIVNLRGARYIKIRCKEIEQMLYRDRVGEPTSAGVAVVNLIGYGYQNSRYDFTNYPSKRFHPIGKLQKLTFRLERPDGTLYNCQGVDNTFLCALTYVVTPNKSVNKSFDGPGEYPAAPGYTGDYIQIQQKRWGEDARATYDSKKATYNRCRPSY